MISIVKASQVAGALVALAGAGWSGNAYLDARLQTVEQRTVETIQQLRCDIIVQQLNALRAKQRAGQLTEYDRVRLDQLEAQFERLCKG